VSGSLQKRKDSSRRRPRTLGSSTAAPDFGDQRRAGVAKNREQSAGKPLSFLKISAAGAIRDLERIGVLGPAGQANDTLDADVRHVVFQGSRTRPDTRSYGHWFTASNLSNVVTDANGTAIA